MTFNCSAWPRLWGGAALLVRGARKEIQIAKEIMGLSSHAGVPSHCGACAGG